MTWSRLRACTLAVGTLAALAPPAAAAVAVPPPPRVALSWQLRPTGVEARLRGLDAVSTTVAWAAGSDGAVLRTTDGGSTWQPVAPPASGELAFRDVAAFDRDTAVILAIGAGDASRVYRTRDGGRSWRLAFTNPDPDAFYDCLDFFDRDRGLALSDPVDGKFRIAATSDGGRSWKVLPGDGMPRALKGEFAFAASGTCLTTAGEGDAWFATGGAALARVFHSSDGGRTWAVAATRVRTAPGGGIFSLAFRTPKQGLAVGGDFEHPDANADTVARSFDGGRSWALARGHAPDGYRSGVAFVPDLARTAVAVGPTGSDATFDRGISRHRFDRGSFDAVDCAPDGSCWAAGEEGRAARLVVRPARQ